MFRNEILLECVTGIILHKRKYPPPYSYSSFFLFLFFYPVGFPVNIIMQVYKSQKF